tara:strand:+ start:555 stop:764 length:210 start_codon:yes stop_codon:yes gene_type:complete
MTLKEQFYPYCDNEYSDKWVSAENCEDVADEFAIGFAEWFASNYTEEIFYKENYTKELLEIYKTEKGLL